MGPVWALLLLLPIAQGAEVCDTRQNNIVCYGALGETIEIRLMDSGSTTEKCFWKKKAQNIFTWKNNTVTLNELKNRSYFNNDTGIFQLFNLSKKDTDSYTVEFFTADGIQEKIFTHNLTVEAPVSSVHLEHQCLSKGEMKVICTPEEGDSPEFSWTLNGQNLTDPQLLSKNNTITLKQNTEGVLRCSVKNHVSEVYKEINISTCGYTFINCTVNGTQISEWVFKANNTLCIEQTTTPAAPNTSVGKTSALTPSTTQIKSTSYPSVPWYIQYWPIIVGALAVVLITGMAAVALICVLKKKCKNSKEEEHELTYADVRILQQPGRRPQQRAPETEVEYGQVRFSNQNQRVPEAADNACIYAMVRR